MEVRVKIFRYDPENAQRPRYDVFTVQADPTDRVVDVLEYIRGDVDATLTFRKSCAHGICGSDAMRINGRNFLACKVLVKDLNTSEITIEPLLGLKVVKDLMVDMDPFMEHYRSIKPYLINDEPPPDGKEYLQSPEQRERFDDTTKCILCAACTTSCPSFWSDGQYIGPAAIVAGHRFVFDSRDKGTVEHLAALNEEFGVWRCRTIFNCTEACPRDIKITQAIAEVKRVLMSGKVE